MIAPPPPLRHATLVPPQVVLFGTEGSTKRGTAEASSVSSGRVAENVRSTGDSKWGSENTSSSSVSDAQWLQFAFAEHSSPAQLDTIVMRNEDSQKYKLEALVDGAWVLLNDWQSWSSSTVTFNSPTTVPPCTAVRLSAKYSGGYVFIRHVKITGRLCRPASRKKVDIPRRWSLRDALAAAGVFAAALEVAIAHPANADVQSAAATCLTALAVSAGSEALAAGVTKAVRASLPKPESVGTALCQLAAAAKKAPGAVQAPTNDAEEAEAAVSAVAEGGGPSDVPTASSDGGLRDALAAQGVLGLALGAAVTYPTDANVQLHVAACLAALAATAGAEGAMADVAEVTATAMAKAETAVVALRQLGAAMASDDSHALRDALAALGMIGMALRAAKSFVGAADVQKNVATCLEALAGAAGHEAALSGLFVAFDRGF